MGGHPLEAGAEWGVGTAAAGAAPPPAEPSAMTRKLAEKMAQNPRTKAAQNVADQRGKKYDPFSEFKPVPTNPFDEFDESQMRRKLADRRAAAAALVGAARLARVRSLGPGEGEQRCAARGAGRTGARGGGGRGGLSRERESVRA